MIPYGRQDIQQADIDAVLEVLQSDFLTQGPMVPRFEQSVAAKVGARHALAVNSATSALHIACLALGLGRGTGCGPRRSPSSPPPTAAATAAPRSISSISIRAPITSVRKHWRPSSSAPRRKGAYPRWW